jgi:pyridoxine 5-phosphate synthase
VLRNNELEQIKKASDFALANGLIVNAGHGLHYQNVQEIAELKKINELNIGHAIVAEALFIGWENAVKKMKVIIDGVVHK